MRKLYWSPYELGTAFETIEDTNGVEAASVRRYYAPQVMGGLGITLCETTYEKKEPNESSLECDIDYHYQSVGFVSGKRITYARIKATAGPLEGVEVDGYVVGKDYIRMKNENAAVVFERLVDLEPFKCFKEMGDVVEVEVEPVKVIPIINGEIDQRFENWELFEQDGYIYGKRFGRIYELIHEETTFVSPFGNKTEKMHTFTIGSGLAEDDEEVSDIDPFDVSVLVSTYKLQAAGPSWLSILVKQMTSYRLKAIDKGIKRKLENKVHRLVAEWKEEIHGV